MKNNKTLSEIKGKISAKKGFLRETYGVEEIGVFGSVARGEETDKSDLDILITLNEPISYFRFFDLEKFIASVVGRKIDLVTKEAIKAPIRSFIMKDLIIV